MIMKRILPFNIKVRRWKNKRKKRMREEHEEYYRSSFSSRLICDNKLVLIAIVCSILLDEKLHLGSILGGVLIVVGLYFVLWGKSKETKRMPSRESDEVEVTSTPSTMAPPV